MGPEPSHLKDPESSELINLAPAVMRQQSVFGSDAVRLVSFNTLLDQGIDLFAHFARHFLGGPSIKSLAGMRANSSLQPSELELIRLLNHIQVAGGRTPRTSMYNLVLHNRDHAVIKHLLQHLQSCRRSITLDDGQKWISELHEANRARFAACITRPMPKDRFHAVKSVNLDFITSDYAFLPGFIDGMEALREMVAQRTVLR